MSIMDNGNNHWIAVLIIIVVAIVASCSVMSTLAQDDDVLAPTVAVEPTAPNDIVSPPAEVTNWTDFVVIALGAVLSILALGLSGLYAILSNQQIRELSHQLYNSAPLSESQRSRIRSGVQVLNEVADAAEEITAMPDSKYHP